ncbi:Uma2 family endonuclease [Actinoplanes sp. NPDC049265]|uniref:Uma2 family endonuclease n=1 Tax=Actinoplanes sp. NPDC049265 TaxID=3363902 RepID=UPI0037188715
MTAATSEHPPANGWTAEDLERFPDDNVRRELLDGVLLVSPSPSRIHQTLAARLVVALEDFCPPDQAVTQNVDVRFSERRSFAPDVLVITAAAADRTGRLYEPHELVLAAEVVHRRQWGWIASPSRPSTPAPAFRISGASRPTAASPSMFTGWTR